MQKFSPPNEKIPVLTKISHSVSPHRQGRLLLYPFNAIWKTLACFTFSTRSVEIISKYFLVWLWTATQFNTSKNEMAFGHIEWVFNIQEEIPNLNLKEWKYYQDYSLKRVLITLLSKIVCGCVTLFHLVYWISVREWPKHTLTSQKFWKMTNNRPEWCHFKMHITGCVSVIKHCFWQTQFPNMQCCTITIFYDLIAKA